MDMTESSSAQDLEAELEREWYHTIELAPGVVTPGWFDTRQVVPRLPIPASLTGMRCLDVATFDGFWAFEMERRGSTEVIAIDILDPEAWDWPVNSASEVIAALERRKKGGHGFQVASRALGSSVEFREMSVYDLHPSLVGEFDFIYVGSLLMHLRDPVRALERVRSICRGQLLLLDNINLVLSLLFPHAPRAALDGIGRPWWWKLNLAGLVRVVEAAGFTLEQPPQRVYMPPGRGHPRPGLSRRLLVDGETRHALFTCLKGDPHAALLARPVRTD